MGFELTTSCIRGKRLTARSRGPHGREGTTPRLILKHFESISPQRHPPDTIWHREETPESAMANWVNSRRSLESLSYARCIGGPWGEGGRGPGPQNILPPVLWGAVAPQILVRIHNLYLTWLAKSSLLTIVAPQNFGSRTAYDVMPPPPNVKPVKFIGGA